LSYGEKDKKCPACKTNNSAVCVLNDIEETFRHLFENCGLAALVEAKNSKPGSKEIRDVSDAGVSKKIKKSDKYDLRLILNVNGFLRYSYQNSTKKEVWPTFLAVADIEPSLRSKFVVLASLWFAPVKPDWLRWMTSFAKKMAQLGTKGFVWRHPVSGSVIKSKLFIVASSVDANVRAEILNMNSPEEEYSCSFCEIKNPGEREDAYLRTTKSVAKQAELVVGPARKEREEQGVAHPLHEKGVKGHSPLACLPVFDIVNSFSPDFVGACLLGVVKNWTKTILDAENMLKPFYVGRSIEKVDQMLRQIVATPPPKELSDLAQWTAADFRKWLFFYSVPCLKSILDDVYFDHHCLLVEAMYTLDKSFVSLAEIISSKELLQRYCAKYAKLYGPPKTAADRLNLHMLLHFADSCEFIGPLWATSSSIFEKASEDLRSLMQGKEKDTLKVVNACRSYSAMHTLQSEEKKSEDVVLLTDKQSSDKIAAGTKLFSHVLKLCVEKNADFASIELYFGVQIKGVVYGTEMFSSTSKTCCHFMAVADPKTGGDLYVHVLLYVKILSEVYFVGREIDIVGEKYATHSGVVVRHFKRFSQTERLVHGTLSTVKYPLQKIFGMLVKHPNLNELGV